MLLHKYICVKMLETIINLLYEQIINICHLLLAFHLLLCIWQICIAFPGFIGHGFAVYFYFVYWVC